MDMKFAPLCILTLERGDEKHSFHNLDWKNTDKFSPISYKMYHSKVKLYDECTKGAMNNFLNNTADVKALYTSNTAIQFHSND